MVEREPQLEQEAPLDDAAREPGIPRVPADGAQEDRVVLREGVEVRLLENLPGLEVVPGAEGELGGRGIHPRRRQDLEGLGDDLGADAVTGDYCERERGTF